MASPGSAGVPPQGSTTVLDNGTNLGVFTGINFKTDDGSPCCGPTNQSTQQVIVNLSTGAQKVFSQNVLYIDPVNGNNGKDGSTPNKAIKTWAEFQKRVGIWGQIKVSSGTLNVFLLTDLPESDPITLLAVLVSTNVFVHGKRTVSASGTLTQVTVQVNATNTRWQIKDSSKSNSFWANKAGDIVLLPVQAGRPVEGWSVVTKDLGVKNANTGEWCEDDGSGFFTQPTANPAPGNSYQVLKLSKAFLGPISLASPSGSPASGPIPVSIFVFTEINLALTTSGDPAEPIMLGTTIGGTQDTGISVFRSRIDTPTLVPATATNCQICGCSVTNPINVNGQVFIGWGTSFSQSSQYPGALVVFGGGRLHADGITCQGDGGVSLFADIQGTAGSQLKIGQWGALDCYHALALDKGATCETGAPVFYGASQQPWGDGNITPVVLESMTAWDLLSTDGTFSVPTLDNTSSPGVPILWNDVTESQKACTFDSTTSTYTAMFTTAWSKLIVAPPAGGLYASGGGFKGGTFLYPLLGSVITYSGF